MKTVAENLTGVLAIAGIERSQSEVGDDLNLLAHSLRRRAIQYRLAAALAEIPRDGLMFTDLASMFYRLACHLDAQKRGRSEPEPHQSLRAKSHYTIV